MMSKANNKPDPRACPKCLKFPCGCPPSGKGDDESPQSDSEANIATKGSAVDSFNNSQQPDLQHFADELTQELLPTLKLVPMPNAHENIDDEDDQKNLVEENTEKLTQENTLLNENKQLPYCTLFALTQNQLVPAPSSNLQQQKDDSVTRSSSFLIKQEKH